VEGPVTRGDVYNIFPFGNAIVRFEVSGQDLVGLLLRNAAASLSGKYPVMQLSGLTVQWRIRAGAPDIVSAEVGGKALDHDAIYTLATNSYIAGQWAYNLGFEPKDIIALDTTIYEAAIDRVGQGPISPPSDKRMYTVD